MSTAATTVTRRTESHKAGRRLDLRAGRSRVVSPRRNFELYRSFWYRSSDYYPRRGSSSPSLADRLHPRRVSRVGSSVRCTSNVERGKARMLRRRARLRVLHRAAAAPLHLNLTLKLRSAPEFSLSFCPALLPCPDLPCHARG